MKIFSILFFCCNLLICQSQNFEGKISYVNTYTSKVAMLKNEALTSMMGTKQDYYIKDGNYKSVFNGSASEWQIYSGKENKLYTKMSGMNYILWNDASQFSDSIISSSINKNDTIILGYTCDKLTLITKNGIQKFYYSSFLKIDHKLYAAHNYGNWYAYLKQSKAVPLIMRVESPQLIIISVAVAVKPELLDDKIFLMPENIPLKKSPF